MKKLFNFVIVSCLFSPLFSQVAIIPKPASLTMNEGFFLLNADTKIVLPKNLKNQADYLNDYLQKVYGFKLNVAGKSNVTGNFIELNNVGRKNTIAGAYELKVTNNAVNISGDDAEGVFYGIQTLIQLLPVQPSQSLSIPQLSVADAPRFAYRGMMLDVSRHFFSVGYIKKYIDFLAFHKINTFHWHLTDDQGWRIEIKKYPRLTEIGGCRTGTIIGHHPGTGNDNAKYCGYYTQEQVKEIVQYAANRFITVIPEIELPGHSSAAIAAYPQLSCFPDESTKPAEGVTAWAGSKTGKQVQQAWGVYSDVFCPTEYTFKFLQDVLDEVIQLFPSQYIHIGGDECPKEAWERSAFAQNLIKQNGLKDEHELQSYFIRRIEKYLNSKGRDIVGWDEILEGGLAPNATVMSWRGEAGGIEAARQKHDVIMTPNSHLYFDHYQGKPSQEPSAIGGYLKLEKVYSFNPTPAVLSNDEAKHIRGVQANLWTEYIPTPEKAEYMNLPRMAALSEVAWTQPQQKNWEDFKQRMEQQYRRYEAWGINYAKSAYDVVQTIVLESAASRATVSFATDSHAPRIYYTLDGSEPGTDAKLYSKPFEVQRSVTIKAANFKNGKQIGKTSVQQVIID